METNTQLQLVTFEQAKLLKEHGFDWLVNHHYLDGYKKCGAFPNRPVNYNDGVDSCEISAPTISLALMWYREVKGIQSGVYFEASWLLSGEDRIDYFGKYKNGISYPRVPASDGFFKSHSEAESALLDAIQQLKFD